MNREQALDILFNLSNRIDPSLGSRVKGAYGKHVRDSFVIESVNANCFSSGKRHLHMCKSDVVLMQEVATAEPQVSQRAHSIYQMGRHSF